MDACSSGGKQYLNTNSKFSEAVKKIVLKNFEKFREKNICVGASFLIRLQPWKIEKEIILLNNSLQETISIFI